MSFHYSSRLGKKLLIRILWLSSLITLFLTALQLYRDYNIDVHLIEQRLELIEKSNLSGIINNLWTFNADVLQVQIDGLQRIQDVQYVAITSPSGTVLQHSGIESDSYEIHRVFPMVFEFESELIRIGELHVSASLSGVYQRLYDKAIIILFTQGIKTFIVSAFILFIVQLLITSPITKLSKFTRQWKINGTKSNFKFPHRSLTSTDEITDLYNNVESMQENLKKAYIESENVGKRFKQIFDGNNDAIIMLEMATGIIIDVNATAVTLLGYSYHELVGKHAKLMHPHEVPELQAFFCKIKDQGTYRSRKLHCQTKSGEKIPAEISASLLVLDNKQVILAMVRDYREQTKIQQQLEHIAFHDTLTGLPNRLLLTDRLSMTLSQALRRNEKCCIIYFDLDNFKTINDSLGHTIGDQLLVQFSKRVLGYLRQEDTFARLGGDEFVLLSSNHCKSIKDIVNSASRLLTKVSKAIESPFELAGKNIVTSYSAGISIYPDNGTSVDELLKNADTAMYRAKNLGRNQSVFFTKELADVMNKKLMIQTALSQAIEQNEFILVYQAKIDPLSNLVTGAEVLLRWNNKELGYLTPLEFIPILEDSGQITVIDHWVMQNACTQWQQAINNKILDKKFKLSINVSGKQFNSIEFVQQVKNIVESSGISPHNIEIEVTEQSLLKNINDAEVIMNYLVEYGVDFALDDFGTGYSSLSYLHRLPVQTLKIDRSFTNKIGEDQKQARLICSIIQMAHQLGIEVVAEGVETESQQAFLVAEGCDIIQGFYHSKPLEWKEFVEFVKDRNGQKVKIHDLTGI